MKFRKRPIVIDAILFNGLNSFEIHKWSSGNVFVSPVLEPGERNPSGVYLQVKTLEGVMTADPGDWIIRGALGEYYPCKPWIFDSVYEPVEET